tara:strand:- start:94 stop:705 length:612 start_codon:yes stop_codon:yes gene_type:complete
MSTDLQSAAFNHSATFPTTKDTHMPQLDKVSYFTQFFWLTLTITTFYITLLKFYLPTLTRILKMRAHKVNLAQESTDNTYQHEQEQVLQMMQNTVRQSLQQSKQALQNSFETTEEWVGKTVQKTNQEQFETVHAHYQAKLGDEMTAHTMTQNQLKTLLPMSAYTTCGFSHYGHNFVQTYFLRKLLGQFTHKGKSGKKATKKKR